MTSVIRQHPFAGVMVRTTYVRTLTLAFCEIARLFIRLQPQSHAQLTSTITKQVEQKGTWGDAWSKSIDGFVPPFSP